MPYVVTEKCQDCVYADCTKVCPVDAFRQGKNNKGMLQLIIDPDICIDCAACEPECPVEAIHEESEVPQEFEHAIAYNAECSKDEDNWQQITDPDSMEHGPFDGCIDPDAG